MEPRSRAREQKLLVSENYHVMTTIDEIHKAQKRAEMFADQDIKVEKTKEKRNTLESFIYDTRSKVNVFICFGSHQSKMCSLTFGSMYCFKFD